MKGNDEVCVRVGSAPPGIIRLDLRPLLKGIRIMLLRLLLLLEGRYPVGRQMSASVYP